MKTAVSIELVTDDVDGFAYRHLAIILKRLLRDHGWKCRTIRPSKAETQSTPAMPEGSSHEA